MGNLDQVWNNVLRISQGDTSVYERTTSSFEDRSRENGTHDEDRGDSSSRDSAGRESGWTSKSRV